MNAAPHVVTRRLVVELSGPFGDAPAEAELRYHPADPYAVSIAFLTGTGSEVVWIFARSLLMQGVCEPVGDGDVQVSPSVDETGRAAIHVVLHSPDGNALVRASARDVLDFLAHTTRVVWPGTEGNYLSADEAIAELLVGD